MHQRDIEVNWKSFQLPKLEQFEQQTDDNNKCIIGLQLKL